MQIQKLFILLFFVTFNLILNFVFNKQKQSLTRFEKGFKECSRLYCKDRLYDDDCVFKCMSLECYNLIVKDYIIEFGEVNLELKANFENCYIGKKSNQNF